MAQMALDQEVRDGAYIQREGIFMRPGAVTHDSDQYDARGYEVLNEMQRRHFWYRGRHQFLRAAVDKHLPQRDGLRVIDLGAGCGGWMFHARASNLFPGGELALGDSSLVALSSARSLTGGRVGCFQIDLLDLQFEQRWDAAFLLDVIEHLDDDVAALKNAYESLVPGGTLFVTVPALQAFWSWNDEVVRHRRRYSVPQLSDAARQAGFEVLDARYFMFLTSPLLMLSRKLNRPRLNELDDAAQWALVEKTHRVPPAPVNGLLSAVLALETPLSRVLRFPWGTSLLGVLRRPS